MNSLSLKEKAYKKIRADIVANRLVPGQSLKEQELSIGLKISKTPVREAIQLLYKEGFVQVIPQKGCFVSPVALSDIREIMQIREALEGIAAGEAAVRCDRERLSIFKGEFERIAENFPVEYEVSSELGKRFHGFLIQSTGNRRLIDILENVNVHLDRIRSIFAVKYHQIKSEQIHSEHLAILQAVQEGNRELAEKEMRRHITNFWETLKSLL
jgi:DNA-binding GntR family transcriptional regulator